MVPKGWESVHLGEVIRHKKGYAFNSKLFCAQGKRVVRISDTTRNSIHDESPIFIPNDIAVNLLDYELKQGDIILTTVGSRPHLLDSMVGKTVTVPKSAEGSLLNQNMVILRPKKGMIGGQYLSVILQERKFTYFISTLIRGNANQVSIALSDFFVYKFLLPSFSEQVKITQIISTWDKAIETTEQLLNNSQQQKKAWMQQLLTAKKRFPDFAEKWQVVTIKKMGKVVSGGTPDTNIKEYWDGDILWVTPTDVTALKTRFISNTKRRITDEGVKNSSATKMPSGTLLVCTRATVGYLSISTTEITTNQGFKNLIPSKSFDVNFLYYLFCFFKFRFIRYACGSTFLELSKKDFEKLYFLCPVLNEQEEISSVFSIADAEIEILQQQLEYLKQEKKALMQQLLTGKRRVLIKEKEGT